jgi:hypothetical protein
MAHFAKLINNAVVAVVTVNNSILLDENGIEQEQKGINYLKKTYREPLSDWKQTSYNTNLGQHSSGDNVKAFRKNYAGIGMAYDPVKDCFYVPKQFDNWVYDEEKGAFFPPIAIPNSSTFVVDENNTIHLKHLNWNQEDTRWENKETINSTILYIWNPNSLVWEENNN